MDGCSRQNPAYRSAKGEGLRGSGGPPYGLRGRSVPPLAPRSAEIAKIVLALTVGLATTTARCEHVFAQMIVCVLIPRFELVVAAGGRQQLAAGPVALAPETGREQLIGEVSAAAEAQVGR